MSRRGIKRPRLNSRKRRRLRWLRETTRSWVCSCGERFIHMRGLTRHTKAECGLLHGDTA